jgi:hypothetical protein
MKTLLVDMSVTGAAILVVVVNEWSAEGLETAESVDEAYGVRGGSGQ